MADRIAHFPIVNDGAKNRLRREKPRKTGLTDRSNHNKLTAPPTTDHRPLTTSPPLPTALCLLPTAY